MAEKKKQNTGQMRLDKFLTEMGKGSRSQVKEFARKGRIQVNGQTVKAADTKVASRLHPQPQASICPA